MKKNETQSKDPTKKETMYIDNAAWFAIFWTIGLLSLIYTGSNKTLKDKPEIILNNICEFGASLICTVLISIIAYNVKRKRIFIKANAYLIKAIGFIVGISGLLTSVICENLLDHKAWTFYYYPKYYLMVIGFFIVAIGYVFQLAIKMKEEQDLTI